MISSELSETLMYTPTWVVAGVCTVIVVISLLAERVLHYLGMMLKRNRNDAVYEALQKIKEELMLLGFISLLLTAFQHPINDICIRENVWLNMLPCKKEGGMLSEQDMHLTKNQSLGLTHGRRRLFSESADSHPCTKEGKVPLLSVEALHQLHMFIFVLAAVHVGFCACTMVLGGAKIREWKNWEETIRKEITTQEKNGYLRHARTHRDFVLERAKGLQKGSILLSWILSFFKQFYASLTKSDYKALRSAFIMRHCCQNKYFDFHKYMMRALQDDFRIVVGISWYLWLFVIIFLLLNVNGWHAYFWLSFLPLILLVVVGAKLEHVITSLAQEAAGRFVGGEQEAPHIKPSNHYFWFNHPGVVLYLIHFILFQNSFELAFFFWIWSTYGFKSCILGKAEYIIPRLVLGAVVQVLSSYSTLPLYAIVTQMGDMFKQAIFDEQLRSTLHDWVENVRKRKRSSSSESSLLKVLKAFNPRSSGDKMQNTAPEVAPAEFSSLEDKP